MAGIGDFNGDGPDDVLLKHNDGTVTNGSARRTGASSAITPMRAMPSDRLARGNTGDFNGDTRDDVLLRHDDGTITNWLGQANGSFFSNHAVAAYGARQCLDGGGDRRLQRRPPGRLLLVHSNGAVTNWLGQANGGFVSNHASASYVLPAGWHIAGTGDFNGDLRDDLLLATKTVLYQLARPAERRFFQ